MTLHEPVIIEADDLRVVFEQTRDRWRHRIEMRVDDAWKTFLQSLEGDADDAWPPSPAFQDTYLQNDPIHGESFCATGISGHSHWSLSCGSQLGESGKLLHFDVACRTREAFLRIGSTYRTVGDTQFTLSQDRIDAQRDDSVYRIATRNVTAFSGTDQQLRFDLLAPPDLPDLSQPETWRWAYSVGLGHQKKTICQKAI